MLNFIARRRGLFGAAALIAVIAAIVGWLALPTGAWLAAVLAVATLVSGLGALAFARVIRAVRELYRDVTELKEETAALRSGFAESEQVRARLALLERRLSALAIKFEATDEFDEPKS